VKTAVWSAIAIALLLYGGQGQRHPVMKTLTRVMLIVAVAVIALTLMFFLFGALGDDYTAFQ